MTIRFFILQTHYRSTLDFGNEALQAAEKGMKRLWEAFDILKKMVVQPGAESADKELESKINRQLDELDDFMKMILIQRKYWPTFLKLSHNQWHQG
jgi:cysteinyl-tRNA synthetase